MNNVNQKKLLTTFLVLGLLWIAFPAEAALVTITGTTDYEFGNISTNSSVLIKYEYDETLGEVTKYSDSSAYEGAILTSFTIGGVGGYSYTGSPYEQYISETSFWDSYSIAWTLTSGYAPGGLSLYGIEISLSGPASTFTGTSQLPTPEQLTQLTDYQQGRLVFWNNDGDSESPVTFSIENISYSASSVPEPATMILFGLGLLGVAGINRRKTA